MLLPDSKQAIHKAWLYRLLAAIYDNQTLSGLLYFKGGTCAAMLGWLDRFSIDLDFDFVGKKEDLKTSIDKKVNQKVIDQDINHLISADRFQKIRKVLKREVLMFLRDEVKRLYNLGR